MRWCPFTGCRAPLLYLGIAALAASACGESGGPGEAGHAPLTIRTVSTRADRVSGGDVLVEVANLQAGSVAVTLNGRDITATFHPGNHPDAVVGLVSGLDTGPNEISVTSEGQGTVTLGVSNYPVSGPITSGPHIEPFICDTNRFELPDETFFTDEEIVDDPTCSAPTRITYLYRPTGGEEFVPLSDRSSLPTDVATTTTTTGATVNFVVRVETSTINRGIYQSAILHDPTVEPEPTPHASPAGWNRRLIAVQGFGCTGGWYRQGPRIGNITTDGMAWLLLQPAHLGEGYALFSNTLQHPSNNCNSVLSAETGMMSKEHFIETYGEPVYTVSAGASGGSYGSFQPADQLPGLIDGVMVARTFVDPKSIALSGLDARLLVHYFEGTDQAYTDEQKSAISGYKVSGDSGTKAMIDAAAQSGRADPVPGRDVPGLDRYRSASFGAVVPESKRYHPETNPRGARGNVFDASRNIYGVDPVTGFALRTFDNVGVQYGVRAFEAGVITTEQFLALNEEIGGYDQDVNYTPARAIGDAGAIERAHQSGLQFGGNGGTASIPVVNLTGMYNEDAAYHYQWFHFALRERMERANGNADNHVSWRGATGAVPFDPAWNMFIKWMEAIEQDTAPGSAREKTLRNKPDSAVDGCWTSPTDFVGEPQTLSNKPDSTCNKILPSWTFPRHAAGGPAAADVLKCQLEKVDRAAYAVTFSDAEFARLQTVFPDGVCDWTQAGVGHTGVLPWASFGPAPENLVFDVTAQ